MIAGELFRLDDAVDDLEGDIIDDEVEKSFRRENAANQHFEFGPPVIFEPLAVDGAPRREAVEPGRQRPDARRDPVADDQRLIEAHQFRRLGPVVLQLRMRPVERSLASDGLFSSSSASGSPLTKTTTSTRTISRSPCTMN